MYTSIGVLQRDAPSQGHTSQFQTAQKQMATDLVTSVKAFKKILQEDLPTYFGTDNIEWPTQEEIKVAIDRKIQMLEGSMTEKEQRLAAMKALYDKIIQENLNKD